MAELEEFYDEYGATVEERQGQRIAVDYGRPERTHRAVRNGVGVTVHPFDVILVTGDDRIDYVNNVVSNQVPAKDGRGSYAFLCDPQGRIETELTVVNAGERLLLFVPPGRGSPTVDGWEAFIQDVDFEVVTDRFAVFGVHGPQATPKVATVFTGDQPPDERLTFARGEIGGAGVSLLRTDAPAGETGYVVVASADDAEAVPRALVSEGPAAPPFGEHVWNALTLEAGTPLFETELTGRIPNVTGVRSAVDFDKGCFVGQEIVSKVENVGRPSRQLVGLRPEALPLSGAEVAAEGDSVGEITRAIESPIVEAPIALAYVDFGLDEGLELTVDADGSPTAAWRASLPFVDGSERSGRLPEYP